MNALGFENRLLGLTVVDIDAACGDNDALTTIQKRGGDILVRTTDLEITDRVQGHCCSRKQFAIDGKTVVMVDSNGGSDGMQTPINMIILDW